MPAIRVIRWLARLLGVALFLFWGAFFLEHTVEWFAQPLRNLPPLHVIMLHTLHFLMLAGFVIAWRWEGVGGAMIVLFAVLFFVGTNAPHFIPVTILPAVLFLIDWYWSRSVKHQPA